MAPTPTQALASIKLGTDVVGWANTQRNRTPQPSYRTIATELRLLTEGQVDVTDETVRLWCTSEQVAS